MLRLLRGVRCGLLAALLPIVLAAAEPTPPPPIPDEPPKPPAPERDPFAPTERIRTEARTQDELRKLREELQRMQKAQQDAAARELAAPPVAPSAVLPRLGLKGIALAKGGAAAALLDVPGEGVFLIHVGDVVHVAVGGRNVPLKVRAIGDGSATLEAGGPDQILVVR